MDEEYQAQKLKVLWYICNENFLEIPLPHGLANDSKYPHLDKKIEEQKIFSN